MIQDYVSSDIAFWMAITLISIAIIASGTILTILDIRSKGSKDYSDLNTRIEKLENILKEK